MGETPLQVFQIPPTVPFEEILVRAEYGRKDKRGDVAPPQLLEIVEPEVVLGKKHHRRMQQVDKPRGVGGCVHRQIAHKVGLAVVLAHLIARRGEKCHAHPVFRMPSAELLQHRACLFKLSQRRGVEPGRLLLAHRRHCQPSESAFPSLHHLAGLAARKGGQPHTGGIASDSECI